MSHTTYTYRIRNVLALVLTAAAILSWAVSVPPFLGLVGIGGTPTAAVLATAIGTLILAVVLSAAALVVSPRV